MVAAKRRGVSATEMDVLKALWECGAGTVREIQSFLQARGRQWAYTTVLTLLQRLQAKGYVTSARSSGIAHVFRPSLTREGWIRQHLHEISDQVCGGSATPLVLALVQDRRFTPEEIEQFRSLLDRLESEEEPKKGKAKEKRE